MDKRVEQVKNELNGPEMLGHEIQRIRESMGMTTEQLATVMGNGCTDEIISQYENGTLPMETDTFFALVDALGITPNDLAPQKMREKAPCLFGYAKLNGNHRKTIDSVVTSFLRDEGKQVTG